MHLETPAQVNLRMSKEAVLLDQTYAAENSLPWLERPSIFNPYGPFKNVKKSCFAFSIATDDIPRHYPVFKPRVGVVRDMLIRLKNLGTRQNTYSGDGLVTYLPNGDWSIKYVASPVYCVIEQAVEMTKRAGIFSSFAVFWRENKSSGPYHMRCGHCSASDEALKFDLRAQLIHGVNLQQED